MKRLRFELLEDRLTPSITVIPGLVGEDTLRITPQDQLHNATYDALFPWQSCRIPAPTTNPPLPTESSLSRYDPNATETKFIYREATPEEITREYPGTTPPGKLYRGLVQTYNPTYPCGTPM